jgi:hypothetical protein
MPKTKLKLAGAVGVSELTQHGWKIEDSTAGSTTLSLPISARDKAQMKGANSSTGFLSAGTVSSFLKSSSWTSGPVSPEGGASEKSTTKQK